MHVEPGHGGLTAVVLGVDDVTATERLLQRRGLAGDASGFDVDGLTWRLAPSTRDVSSDLVLDHLVIRTGDAERAAATYGARLSLDLRLDRTIAGHGFRGLFFRCGEAVVEVVVPSEGMRAPDAFGGVAWRVDDLEASRRRLIALGAAVSRIRPGRKPGTRVATVRDVDLATPTLLIGTA